MLSECLEGQQLPENRNIETKNAIKKESEKSAQSLPLRSNDSSENSFNVIDSPS